MISLKSNLAYDEMMDKLNSHDLESSLEKLLSELNKKPLKESKELSLPHLDTLFETEGFNAPYEWEFEGEKEVEESPFHFTYRVEEDRDGNKFLKIYDQHEEFSIDYGEEFGYRARDKKLDKIEQALKEDGFEDEVLEWENNVIMSIHIPSKLLKEGMSREDSFKLATAKVWKKKIDNRVNKYHWTEEQAIRELVDSMMADPDEYLEETEEKERERLTKLVNDTLGLLKEDLSDAVTYGNSSEFLKKYGLDKYFYFDGLDLVNKEDSSTTGIRAGSEEVLLKEIKRYFPDIFKELKLDSYLTESKLSWEDAIKDSYNSLISSSGEKPTASQVLEDVADHYDLDIDVKIELDDPIKYNKWLTDVEHVLNTLGLEVLEEKLEESLTESTSKYPEFLGFINGTLEELNPEEFIEKVKTRRQSLHTNRIAEESEDRYVVYTIVCDLLGFDLDTCDVYVDVIKEEWNRKQGVDMDDPESYKFEETQERVLMEDCGKEEDKWDKAIKVIDDFKAKTLKRESLTEDFKKPFRKYLLTDEDENVVKSFEEGKKEDMINFIKNNDNIVEVWIKELNSQETGFSNEPKYAEFLFWDRSVDGFEKLNESLTEDLSKGVQIAKIVAELFEGQCGPFAGEDPIINGNSICLYSQATAGDEYTFNDDGSIDVAAQYEGVEEDEDEDGYTYHHYNSFRELTESGDGWFYDMDPRDVNKIEDQIKEVFGEALENKKYYYFTDPSGLEGEIEATSKDDAYRKIEDMLAEKGIYVADEIIDIEEID